MLGGGVGGDKHIWYILHKKFTSEFIWLMVADYYDWIRYLEDGTDHGYE